MPKKVVKKQKQNQKQKQKQTVIVNISQPTRRASYKKTSAVKEQPLPLLPSFNINQPSQPNDLSRILGLLDRRLETERKLFIPTQTNVPSPVVTTPSPVVPNRPSLDEIFSQAIKKEPEIFSQAIKKEPEIFSQAIKKEPEITLGQSLTEKKPPLDISEYQDMSKPAIYKPPLSASIEPELPELPPYTPAPPTKLEKLQFRYQKAFGKAYDGDPNIKIKAFTSMIVQQEKLNRELNKRKK